MNQTRRQTLQSTGAFASLIALGLVTQSQAQAAVDSASFQVKTLEDALKAIGGTPATSDQVSVVSPDIAENGAVVPVAAMSKLPGTESIAFLVAKNPTALAASFDIPAGTEPGVSTRIKMAETSDVYVLVKAQGKYHVAKKEIKVTIGGCGG